MPPDLMPDLRVAPGRPADLAHRKTADRLGIADK
jgi:hypothetical protein